MRVWRTRDAVETEALGARLCGELRPDRSVLLEGALGAGKTVLVRGLAVALGLDPRVVQSPSYTLIHEYGGGSQRLVHIDLHRLEPAAVAGLGVEELLDGPGIKAVEWPERLPWEVSRALRLRLIAAADGSREIVELGAGTHPEPVEERI